MQTKQRTREYVGEPPVTAISTPNLTEQSASKLLNCINEVRSGEKVFFVRLNNRKQTKSPKRMPNRDFQPDPGLSPGTHEGWLVSAPTNKKGKVYLHLLDRARAGVDSGVEPHDLSWADIHAELAEDKLLPKNERRWNHTRITMLGIRSFRLIKSQDRYPEPVQSAPVLTNPQAMVQSLMLQSQALMLQAQALSIQAFQPQPPAQ
jgi:hypothetical protein